MEMPSHGVPPVVHHYENEASPIAPPLDWGPLFAHGLRQLHRLGLKALIVHMRELTFFHHHCRLSMQSMVTSPLTYALVRPFWMDRERERKCVGVLMDFIFKFVRFFFPTHKFEGIAVVRMWMLCFQRTVCICAFIFPLPHESSGSYDHNLSPIAWPQVWLHN